LHAVIPIEIKSGKYSSLRSLMQFVDAAPYKLSVSVYSGEFNFEKQITISGKEFVLMNIPFYLVSEIYLHLD